MIAEKVSVAGPTPAQKKAYGIAAGKACQELGIFGAKEQQEYRRKVVSELTGRERFSDVRSNTDIDAIMQRLWTDAGQYQEAARFCINYERQMAYIIKVLAVQLMHLKGADESEARRYIGGILYQAHIPNGFYTSADGYWMDIRPDQVAALLKILDTERRRMIRGFNGVAGAFSDRVIYEVDGPILKRIGVHPGYFSKIVFKVNFRAA